jgi:basic membrane protein A and related proteins
MKFNKLVVLMILVSFLSCGKDEVRNDSQSASEDAKLKVGLVFDIGGRGDKSFNDAAYKGLEMAKEKFGIDFEVIDPGDGSDRESALRMLASKKDIDLIFGVGFIFTEDINNVAREFPDKKFGCIDYSVDDPSEIPGNVSAIIFREEEGSFLVGAIAGLVTKTNSVGFLGGMESALIRKFEAGYKQGVEYANPECKILSGYISVSPEGFKNPGKAKEIALSQYSKGSDIIYHASGLSGLGLFEAAREKNKLAIGVDMDQYKEAPGFILTSMVKQVDEAIFKTIEDIINNNFKPGVTVFGLGDNGVSFVYDENNKDLIPQNVVEKVNEFREKIISGEITVRSK